jgi:tripartite-type tricarboxylate transporter receptor subunit TctC
MNFVQESSMRASRLQKSKKSVPSLSKRSLLALGFGAALAPIMGRAADAWPSQAVRVISPFAPGGTTDVYGRILVDRFTVAFNQLFILEARPVGHRSRGTFAVVSVPNEHGDERAAPVGDGSRMAATIGSCGMALRFF